MIDKRQEIVKAALKLFVEFGFHGTPTSKIAQEAGVANGTLFHYFKTKDELVVALYIDIKERMAQHMYKNLDKSVGFKEMLKTLILHSIYWALDNKTEFRFVHQFHSSPFECMVPPDIVASQSKPHIEMLQTAMDAKLLKQVPIALLFSLLSSHVFGIFQYLTSEDFSQEQQKKVVEQSFEMIWDMIR